MEKDHIRGIINLHKVEKKLFDINNIRGDLPKTIEDTNNQIDIFNI